MRMDDVYHLDACAARTAAQVKPEIGRWDMRGDGANAFAGQCAQFPSGHYRYAVQRCADQLFRVVKESSQIVTAEFQRLRDNQSPLRRAIYGNVSGGIAVGLREGYGSTYQDTHVTLPNYATLWQ